MSDSYYNTTHQTGKKLAEFERAAETQEAAVLAFFKKHPRKLFTAEDIGRRVLPRSPRTSWGRALTNLKDMGLIEKTDRQVDGEWGRPIYQWRLRPQKPVQGQLL